MTLSRVAGSATVPVASVGVPPTALHVRGAHAPSRATVGAPADRTFRHY